MMQLEDWLDDLCVRFIVNIPAEELASIERICFQIEEAQWYYEDFVRPNDPSLPSLSLKPFFTRITQRCPLFAEWAPEQLGHAFERFLKYKNRVPVRGAILLNDKMDQVLLVKGWKKSATWSFPRGKINKDEDDLDCAIREAWEETGFDIKAAGLVEDRRKVKSIEKTMRNQNMKMFVFKAVPQDTKFVPQTRKEISKVEWFKLADLPTEKRKNQDQGQGLNPNKFYVVAPFMLELRKIISAEKKREHRQSSKLARQANQSAGDIAVPMSPIVPSSLPEVDHSISTSLQYNDGLHRAQAAPTLPELDINNKAKSNALLALLHGNSNGLEHENRVAPEHEDSIQYMRHAPPIPVQHMQPPEVNIYEPAGVTPAHHHHSSSFDMYPAVHPAAPPPSALPQLNQHTKTLLDAFNQPSPRLASASPRPQLPTAKQSLLDAFKKPATTVVPQQATSSASNPGGSLLSLLKMSPNVAPIAPITPTTAPIATSPASRAQPVSDSNANALLNLLNQPKLPPTQRLSPVRSYAAAASAPTVVAGRGPGNVAELASTTEKQAPPKQEGTTPDLINLLQAKAPEKPTGKSRKGQSSATLDRPFDAPQLKSTPKPAPLDLEARREPTGTNKKLFDPKIDSNRPGSQRSFSPRDERNRLPKSPRTARPPQGRAQTPSTPKSSQLPFQPQILRRPQTSEGEPMRASPLQGTQSGNVEERASANISPATIVPVKSPEVEVPAEPKITSPITLADVFATQPAAHHDPQREALLSLLKGQPPPPTAVERVPTPLAALTDIPPPSITAVAQSESPIPVPSQLISPVHDDHDPIDASRSRVSSLASATPSQGAHRPSIQKRETAPGDKAFLLSFLKDMAAGTS